jgi:5,10-methylenetetrahydromethanopterin reductase
MEMEIKLGLGLHVTVSDFDDLIKTVKDAEAFGYEQIWVGNEKFFHDMYVLMGVISQHTNKAELGTFVSDPYSHHPALTAMALSTVDEVSHERAILGIGAGGTGFPAMGINRIKPAKAIKEAIIVIKRLWKGETIDFDGEVIQCTNCKLNILPPRPDIPVIVATRGNYVLQAGGEVADGVMIATYAEPRGIQHALSMVSLGAEKGGRTLDDVEIISRVDACVSRDRNVAIEAVKPMVGVFLWTSYPDREFVHKVGLTVPDELEEIISKRDYNLMALNTHLIPDEFVDKFCWAGTSEEVSKKVAEVVKLGIPNITILPHPPKGGTVHETIYEFAHTVKPAVQEMLM